jgi:hypothetical protein
MFVNLVERQFSTMIKNLKTDNGGEYLTKAMSAVLETMALSMNYYHHMQTKSMVYLSI